MTGQYSRLGAILDPIVDRALVLAGLVVCWNFELLPRWAIAVLVARELGVPLTDVLALIDFDIVWQVLTEDFSFLDGVFYAFALYEGFRFALVPAPKLAVPAPQAPIA